jgi:hypothetical protein
VDAPGRGAGSGSVAAGNLLAVAALVSRYDRWQREAIATAYTLTNATAGQVAELAIAGELEHPSGARLGPFGVPESTVRSIARRARGKEAAAQAALGLAEMAPRDAVERMRLQLADVIEAEFDRIDFEHEEGRSVRGETLRQLGRAIREFASIPGPTDPRPPKPGAKVNGVRDGSETRGGLAGKVLAASRANGTGF